MQDFRSFLAFPLNLLVAVIWMVIWGWLWKSQPKCRVMRFILSPTATVSAIGLLLCACLWVGFSGDRSFVESILFVLVLLYVQTVLYAVILRGWRRLDGAVRWRFIFLHAGLLLAIGAGFWGSPDFSEVRVALGRGERTETAYNMDGSVAGLGYELLLTDFETEFSEDGKPSHYEAFISVDGSTPQSLTVNDPYGVSFGEDIYLTSVTDRYCVLQIVREPWRYFALAGIIMLLAGAFMLFIKGPRR